MSEPITRRGFVKTTAVAVSALSAAAAVSSRDCRPARRRPAGTGPVLTYVDLDGWMMTADESRKLRAPREGE